MHSSLIDITAKQLRQAAGIKERINELENELRGILGGTETTSLESPRTKRMSAAGRAAIAAGARARWAKVRGSTTSNSGKTPRRKMSAAGKARLAAFARARWKKAKAAGKATL